MWGNEGGYLSGVRIYTDDRPQGRGPSGTAVRENRIYVCNDMWNDRVTLPRRERVEEHGLRASAGA